MRLKDFTPSELDKFRKLCNFTADERQYFELKLKGKSNIATAEEMHVAESTVSNLSRKVKSKIARV